MALDKKDIEKIAWLARLDITPGDIPGYARDLSSILDLVEQMNQVDTANTEPLAHPLDLDARGRDDTVTETNQREHFQQHAPAVANGHYLVPKVIE
jgi:aspartyl-tRNA(Asn)/glutamyl-tRNA(Gln) amidotransferase subunit C